MTDEEKLAEAVARGWCHPENAGKQMDPELLAAIIEEVAKVFAPPARRWPI